MEMAVEGKNGASQKFKKIRPWNWRALTGQNLAVNGNLLEALSQVYGGSHVVVSRCDDEGGVVRMKIVVKKRDLKKMLEVMRAAGESSSHHLPLFSPSLTTSHQSSEQRLNLLRRKHASRNNQTNRSRWSSWRPALHSIPEEL